MGRCLAYGAAIGVSILLVAVGLACSTSPAVSPAVVAAAEATQEQYKQDAISTSVATSVIASNQRIADEAAREAVSYYQPCPQSQTLQDVVGNALKVGGYKTSGTQVVGHADDIIEIAYEYISGGAPARVTWDYHPSTGEITGEDATAINMLDSLQEGCDMLNPTDAPADDSGDQPSS